jgi:hypothetical protein
MDYDRKVHALKNVKRVNYYNVWEPFMKKYDCKAVCELGVFSGDNFMNMVAHGPKLAVAVDTWKNDGLTSPDDVYTPQFLKQQYQDFKNRVGNLSFVKVLREDTAHASSGFKDKSFDFVYIDADPSVKGCTRDLEAWYPKVKSGKFLVGHNYNKKFGVVEAVNKFAQEHKLEVIRFGVSNWAFIKPYFG